MRAVKKPKTLNICPRVIHRPLVHLLPRTSLYGMGHCLMAFVQLAMACDGDNGIGTQFFAGSVGFRNLNFMSFIQIVHSIVLYLLVQVYFFQSIGGLFWPILECSLILKCTSKFEFIFILSTRSFLFYISTRPQLRMGSSLKIKSCVTD